jgi:hypothetical protein
VVGELRKRQIDKEELHQERRAAKEPQIEASKQANDRYAQSGEASEREKESEHDPQSLTEHGKPERKLRTVHDRAVEEKVPED